MKPNDIKCALAAIKHKIADNVSVWDIEAIPFVDIQSNGFFLYWTKGQFRLLKKSKFQSNHAVDLVELESVVVDWQAKVFPLKSRLDV